MIAVPGDRLRIDHGTVYINGEILREPYLPEKWTYSNSWPATGQDYVLPPDHYFVMGDNRNHSSDSRVFGPIDASSILGKAEIRIWPLNEFGLLTSRPTLSTGGRVGSRRQRPDDSAPAVSRTSAVAGLPSAAGGRVMNGRTTDTRATMPSTVNGRS